jgi:glycosyltransferase involved in cell wall biosynthesis
MKVLWLCSWYPNKIQPFNGDFVKRHAEAVSLYADVHVLHVARDVKAVVTNDVHIEENVKGRLKETIIYYYSPSKRFRLLERALSGRKYFKLAKNFLKNLIRENGKPGIVHVYIGMKLGILGPWLKKKYNIPYIVTEQWTGLLQEAKENFSALPLYFQWQWKRLLKNAGERVAVSEYLAATLRKRFDSPTSIVIPNVVNTEIFYPGSPANPGSLNFIHISTLDSFKNPDLVLQGFARFIEKNPSARLTIFASRENWMIERCKELQIEKNVSFHSEVAQVELVSFIRQSDALLLYSSYETFGCVIIEANACGVPVIVSDIPVMRELVKDKVNGLLAAPGNPRALAETLQRFFTLKDSFDRKQIAEEAKNKYNYAKVGKEFFEVYEDQLKKG